MSENVDVEFWNGQLLELLVSEEVYVTQIIEKERYLGVLTSKTKTGVPMTIDDGRSVTINF